VIGEAEIWRAAVALVHRHGAQAAFAVSAYADQLVEDGNMAAASACDRVLNAIERLQARMPSAGERIH
jgi:hypothetical protein